MSKQTTSGAAPAGAAAKAPAKAAGRSAARASAKTAAKTAVKADAKAAAKAPAQPAMTAKLVKPAKPAKAPKAAPAENQKAARLNGAAVAPADAAAAPKSPKQKLVRDSFTIPRTEYQGLDALKQRLVQLQRPAKKSEVLRAGIKLLATLPDEALLAALAAVPAIKTGRPSKR